MALPPQGIIRGGHLGFLLGEIVKGVEIRINLIKNNGDLLDADPANFQIEI